MNKSQHDNRYRLLNLSQAELDRKWRLQLEQEQLYEMQSLYAQNTPSSGGGGGHVIQLPPYCGGNKKFLNLRYSSFDFYDDPTTRPTQAELNSFDGSNWDQEDLSVRIRVWRDAYTKAEVNNPIVEYDKRNQPLGPYPEGPVETSIFYKKNTWKNSKVTWWPQPLQWFDNIEKGADWFKVNDITGKSPNEVMPGVTDFTILDFCEDIIDLPTSGNPGDMIWVDALSQYYGWDSEVNVFSREFYEYYMLDFVNARSNFRGYAIKNKNELSLAIEPFLWAAGDIIVRCSSVLLK